MVLPTTLIQGHGVFFDEQLAANQWQPHGVDLTVGAISRILGAGRLTRDGVRLPEHQAIAPIDLTLDGQPPFPGWWLTANAGYLVHYQESIQIPLDAMAYTLPRSSLLRMGATLDGAVWDAGYCGTGAGLLVVQNPQGVIIEQGSRIAQIVFHRLVNPVAQGYNGQYQEAPPAARAAGPMERDWHGQVAALVNAGWLEWTPDGRGAGIDIKVAAETDCSDCGTNGLMWFGYQRRERRRGFAVCPSCDAWLEM